MIFQYKVFSIIFSVEICYCLSNIYDGYIRKILKDMPGVGLFRLLLARGTVASDGHFHPCSGDLFSDCFVSLPLNETPHIASIAKKIWNYFPIQNFPKIFPSSSSVVTSPVMLPR